MQDYFRASLTQSLQIAFPLNHVEMVLQINPRQICRIPGFPSYILGVVNRRGVLTWVLDGNQLMELAPLPAPSGKDLSAIVVTADGDGKGEGRSQRSIAWVVSTLRGTLSASVQPFQRPLKPRLRPLFPGFVSHSKEVIPVLDPIALLQLLYTEVATYSGSLLPTAPISTAPRLF